jgi:hypothetical protein
MGKRFMSIDPRICRPKCAGLILSAVADGKRIEMRLHSVDPLLVSCPFFFAQHELLHLPG